MTFGDLVTIAPFAAAVILAAAIIVADIVAPGKSGPVLVVGLVGLAIVAALTVITGATPATAFGGAYKVDDLTTFLDIVFVGIVTLTLLFGPDYLAPRGLPLAEFAAVLVFAMTGAMLISASADLLVLFIGLELMVLPGLPPGRLSQERRLLDRGCDQVLPPRIVQLGDLPLRPVLRLGTDRHDPDRRRRRASW